MSLEKNVWGGELWLSVQPDGNGAPLRRVDGESGPSPGCLCWLFVFQMDPEYRVSKFLTLLGDEGA